MPLVIVESPTKAKTIRKFLGSDYTVLASMGHVRDLPESSEAVPEEYKKTSWGRLGVNVEKDFEPLYVVPKGKTKTITELKRALKGANEVYLATDEDREGESISWHLLQVLKPKVPVHRMVFHEITKKAIDDALSHPRNLDENLVRAQETRRILDRLVGYSISPVLWKKIAFGLSAGRVQSSALKVIVDRERDRMAFKKATYWDVAANLEKDKIAFEAKLVETNGKRVASGKDFDENTGTLKDKAGQVVLLDQAMAEKISTEIKGATWNVLDVTEKPVTKRPSPPFITSTLQQEANRKLGFSSKETMKLAQGLYERGYITYMRTDSVTLSQEALQAARKMVADRFGKEYVPDAPRTYATTTKGAQEAHEAIRPSLNFTPPNETDATPAERALYEMIWMRTLASQMTDSQQLQVAVTTEAAKHQFHSSGLKILFPGFLRAYVEVMDDAEQAMGDKERILPSLAVGDHPACTTSEALGHETKPPSRFTEAALIQYMEKEGIGRPSTYASIISTLMDRGYIRKVSNALVPSFTGIAVTQLLEKHFSDLVDAKFTSRMEGSLDDIAEGKEDWLAYLRSFFLGAKGLQTRITEESAKIDPEAARTVEMPSLGKDVVIRVGKFGPYFETTHPRSGTAAKASIPEDVAPSDFTPEIIEELLKTTNQGPTTLGLDDASGLTIYLKTGSYGPYLQLGEDPATPPVASAKGGAKASVKKPKRVSIPKNVPLNTLDHAKAELILSLPRLLGPHPVDGKDVRAGLGRFGPYIVHDGDFRSLKADDDVLTVTLPRALELLAIPKGTRGGAKILKTLGEHPKDKKPVTLHQGKFGTYVKHGTKNATLAKDMTAETVTLEQALELLAQRKEKKGRKTKS